VRELMDEMRQTVQDIKNGTQRVATIREKLAEGISALEEVVEWFIAEGGDNPQLPGAAAASYLRLCGVVCGGWMMARAAGISDKELATNGANTSFYLSKLASASFYGAQIMPNATALARTIIEGSHAVSELDETAF
jgi:acyl-CoA dehydrogenase